MIKKVTELAQDKRQSLEKKTVTVKARYLRISSRKLNLISKLLRRKSLDFCEKFLPFSKPKAAKLLLKLVRSGKAAATDHGLDPRRLFVSRLLVGQGPSLKRGRPVARGIFHPIRKKTAHLTLTLQED